MTPTTQRDPSKILWGLSANQHGVVTRRQLMAAGLSAEAVKHRLARGRLHRLRRGVYAVGRPQVSREGAWLAATLSCGPRAALSHLSAAGLWGIREPGTRAPIEVTVPPAGIRPRRGLRVHRAALSPGDVTTSRGVPVVKPALLMLGQATVLSARQLERDINVADALGLISPDELRAAAERFAGRAGVVALRAVLDPHTFTVTDSELERMFLPIVRRAGLERPLTRRRVNGFRVDFFWPSLGLVVETDGLRYHRTPAEQARDLIRDQTHRAAGLEPVRFTHRQVARDKRWVERTLRRVAARLES